MSARRRMTHRTPTRAPLCSSSLAEAGQPPAAPLRISRVAQLSLATSMLLASGLAAAQSDVVLGNSQRYQPLLTTPVDRGPVLTVIDGQYAANARVGQIRVEVRGAGVPADGVSPVTITVRVFDQAGEPLLEPVLVTIEHSGSARVLLPGSDTDEIGPSHKDADRQVPGTQLKVVGGEASFSLIAPNEPEDVTLRLSAGTAEVSGSIDFAPDLREMIAAGLIEGVLRLGGSGRGPTIAPAGLDDGFETTLDHWSRSFGNGRSGVAGRTALFLKGKISGETLLTMSYDSDKDMRATLLRNIKPEEFYPVYGDASVRAFDGRSSSHLYVRLDRGRNALLFGDFNTAEGYTPSGGGGLVAGSRLRQLGAYNRGMTGPKLHLERSDGYVNVYASRDTLRHLVDEVRANGTSGPFAVSAASAVEGSERVELVVRDRNNLASLLSVTPLQRLNDYNFEPFSGRVLLNRPAPSQDGDGNPISLRISYEADQGGQPFWVTGVDGQVNLDERTSVGGSIVNDDNPALPFQLASVNVGIKLAPRSSVVVELARTDTPVVTTTTPSPLPSAPPTVVTSGGIGLAGRVLLDHDDDSLRLRLYASRAEAGFSNAAAGTTPGSQQIGATASYQASDQLQLKTDAQKTHDLTNDAERTGASLGADYQLTAELLLTGGLRRIQETGRISQASSGIGASPSAGSAFGSGSGGGFTGAGSTTLFNLNSPVTGGSTPGSVPDLDATTGYLGAHWKASERIALQALFEQSLSGDDGHRSELGASYQLAERTRVYARAESQTGLASRYGLDPAARSDALAVGIDSSYLPGANAFSEYRLRDSADARSAQLASGLRNSWGVQDGLLLSAGAERLSILSGNGRNATALTAGVDYSGAEFWRGSTRLEWRRLDAPTTSLPGVGGAQDSYLSTLTLARKLDGDWTLLARNYALATDNHGQQANGWQDRFQIGAAYRPVDNNRFDLLTKFEYKVESNIAGDDAWRRVHVGAVQANGHPSRPWWWSARVAGKQVSERFPTTTSVAGNIAGVTDRYRALLLGGRLIYDVTDRIDVGLLASVLRGSAAAQNGSALQRSLGVEAGYLLQANLWLSVGFNRSGFTDRDLSTDYTARGAYLRLRYKFDADLFDGTNPAVNRSLPR